MGGAYLPLYFLMAHTIRKTITGYYKHEYTTKPKLPKELKLSRRVVGSVTESMRSEVDEWIEKGYKESLIIQLALRDWLDRKKSVQESV